MSMPFTDEDLQQPVSNIIQTRLHQCWLKMVEQLHYLK